ncbi:MAG: S9 family peptidase [Planctomycetaceae bacterium]|nr:S9 family peptidase [Planctomycetaceae bacterium]MBT6487023.1 S9 family peptidase [Planctomycetaceae bacterium]MBT6494312.1 S9 family peptidase [Planctomycetaceae bacterium]
MDFDLPAVGLPFALCTLAVLASVSQTTEADETQPDEPTLSIDRIYSGDEFKGKTVSARWLKDGDHYTTLETSADHKQRHDIVRHDPATGKTHVAVAAADLIPPGESTPLKIEDYAWSKDQAKLLVYTNSKRVWRHNSRGDYWLLDRSSKQLRKLGGDAKPSTLMFAKLSPDAEHVAYVREGEIYVEDLFDHTVKRLTHAESSEVINGTTDWVYEEEFGLRDGFRWSPDGSAIAYWQIDIRGVQKFPLVNNTDSLYPKVKWFPYPKVGQRNSDCRVGVVNCASTETTWIELPGESREHYVPKMQWAENSDELLLQQLNRLQNTNRVFLADVGTGKSTSILTETDDAWIDVNDELKWIDDGNQFTWLSDRDGWRHVYLAPRSGGDLTLVTPGEFDVIRLLHVDEKADWLYFIASPDDASQRFLYRVHLDGRDLQRVTPSKLEGTHSYQFSSNSQWAIHRASRSGEPSSSELIAVSDHSSVRVLEDNTKLKTKLQTLDSSPTEFFRVEIGDGVELDAWCIKPPNFDPQGSYPLLVYVYGEPAGQTVVDRWGGSSYLWHLMMAQKGYVVMSFDNRGTKSPRGRAWRKSIYRKIGIIAPQDQAAAVESVLKERPYLDKARVGIWGWSGGGSSSLHAIFKYPKLYRTAIAIAPVPNQRYYDTIYQERYMGLPESNVEGFLQGSPINFAKNLEGDLLLIHGTGDDNCHYQTMEMLIDELIAHNKQFQMMAYPNRTHAIRERKNTSRHLRALMTNFLLQTLPLDSQAKPAIVETAK